MRYYSFDPIQDALYDALLQNYLGAHETARGMIIELAEKVINGDVKKIKIPEETRKIRGDKETLDGGLLTEDDEDYISKVTGDIDWENASNNHPWIEWR